MLRWTLACAASALVLGLASAPPAQALTMKECSTKYQAAKKANTLKGQKWNDFRKAQCGDEDANDADAAAAVPDTPAPAATRPGGSGSASAATPAPPS